MSEANVAIVRAMFGNDASMSKEEILAVLGEVIPALFHSDAEWVEAPERVDAKTHRGHQGIRDSFEHWLEHWGEYRLTADRLEDHGDQVLAVVQESGKGHGSGAATEATVYAVLTFREGKISRYREFYDEATARASLA